MSKFFKYISLKLALVTAAVLYANSACAGSDSCSESKPDIAPLLGDIAWDQNAPYNLLCKAENCKTALTGCTTTAIAQVFAYYKYPATYDWANIKSCYTYDESNTEEAESYNAVATLCYDIAEALNTNYTQYYGSFLDISVDSLPSILSRCFGYNGIKVLRRAGYAYSTFKSIVDNELENGRPVVFLGKQFEGETGMQGHSFVCDGRKDGLYHFNWGDGNTGSYFSLHDLLPANAEKTEYGGFTNDLYILTGIAPDAENSEPMLFADAKESDDSNDGYSCLITSKYNKSGNIHRKSTDKPFDLDVLFNVFKHPNNGKDVKCEFAFGYYNDKTELVQASINTVEYEDGANYQYLNISDCIEVGKKYHFIPIYRLKGTDEWKPMEGSDIIYFEALTADNYNLNYTVSDYDLDITLTGIANGSTCYADSTKNIGIEVSNVGTLDYDYRIDLKYYNTASKEYTNMITLDNVWLGTDYGYKLTRSVTIPSEPGKYEIYAFDQEGDKLCMLGYFTVKKGFNYNTAIEDVNADTEQNNVIYSITGNKVSKGYMNSNRQKLYIIDGKKIIR